MESTSQSREWCVSLSKPHRVGVGGRGKGRRGRERYCSTENRAQNRGGLKEDYLGGKTQSWLCLEQVDSETTEAGKETMPTEKVGFYFLSNAGDTERFSNQKC